MSSYDQNSYEAMFSRILAKLEEQDKVLADIKEQTTKTNGRVTKGEAQMAEIQNHRGWNIRLLLGIWAVFNTAVTIAGIALHSK